MLIPGARPDTERQRSSTQVRPSRLPNVERRVLEAAHELAAQGGFEAVRQREVADRAGVALGTLYKRFRSKDELLIGVLEVESRKLANRLEREPPAGTTPFERVTNYFEVATHYLVRKPRLGRAILRAVTSGDGVSARMLAYYADQMRHVVSALRGPEGTPPEHRPSEADSNVFATILLQVWFGALVGWSGGLYDPPGVLEQVRIAARLVLAGAAHVGTHARPPE
jgi:AcrR family transcriptional regulator